MRQLSLVLVVFLAAAMLAAPAIAQDQRFALRFGLVMVEPTGDIFETHGGFEVDFEWYFHPRVGFEVASLGSLSSEFEGEGDYVTGMAFSTFTVGINGHVVRSEKVDFALGILAGGATYRDIKVEGETATIEGKRDTTFGAQAFVDMTVSRNWAVNLGLKYVDTQVEFDRGGSLDFSPVILRVMGVYRWGKHK
jgi:hypothetical protein